MSSTNDRDRFEWERVERVTVYNSCRRARYPSIARAEDGSLLVLFTQQTLEQECTGVGDLILVRSTDGGKTWSQAQQVYRGTNVEPRALGTMTTLASGRIIAPFTEMPGAGYDDYVATSVFRLLSSEDAGKSWRLGDPDVQCPLSWWAPSGKAIETDDGTLVMPVYGAASDDDLRATIHNCGLLRSTDGGKSWGDFSWIARGGQGMVGAAHGSRFSFEGPSVQILPDGRWLAMVTARRLNQTGTGPSQIDEGPGTPQALCRLWTSDQGRQWTRPDLLMPGAWASLAAMGDHTLCANALWCGWGEMRLEVSDNGFESVFQELPIMERGWTVGRVNRPQEAPPVPTVPYLAWPWTKTPNMGANVWPFEHYGFPSTLPLDDDRVLVVFGRTQRGTPGYDFDPPEWDDIHVDEERIQAVVFRRVKVRDKLAPPLPGKRPRPRGRWVLADRITVEGFGPCAQTANGDLVGRIGDRMQRSSDGGRTWNEVEGASFPEGLNAFGILQSGRWLAAVLQVDSSEKVGAFTVVGTAGGYPTAKERGFLFSRRIAVAYSDDQGKTWHAGEPFEGPFVTAISPCTGHFIESPDGTVSLPIFVIADDEDMSSYSSSNGIIRSHDAGATWGDFSFIFRTHPRGPDDYQPEPRYTEMDVVELPNGHWVAYSRTERLGGGPNRGGTTVALSTDCGRTWTRTGGCLQGVSQQTGVVLPDGGIALTWRTTSWQAPGVAVTYDEGRSFEYLLTGPYETINAFLAAEDEFIVYTAKSLRSDMAAGVYRWIPDNP